MMQGSHTARWASRPSPSTSTASDAVVGDGLVWGVVGQLRALATERLAIVRGTPFVGDPQLIVLPCAISSMNRS